MKCLPSSRCPRYLPRPLNCAVAWCDPHLFCGGDVAGRVLDGWRVLDSEPVALALNASFVDQDASVCCETSKGDGNVVVDRGNLPHGTCVLKLQRRPALHCQHNTVLSADAHLVKTKKQK